MYNIDLLIDEENIYGGYNYNNAASTIILQQAKSCYSAFAGIHY